MIILGIILLLAGAGSAVYGLQLNDSMEAQLDYIFTTGTKDPGTTWIVAGAIVAVIGLVLLVSGINKKGRNAGSV